MGQPLKLQPHVSAGSDQRRVVTADQHLNRGSVRLGHNRKEGVALFDDGRKVVGDQPHDVAVAGGDDFLGLLPRKFGFKLGLMSFLILLISSFGSSAISILAFATSPSRLC